MRQTAPNNRLRQARLSRRWTQAELAERIGASPLSVIRWEAGKTFPTAYYRQQLCQLFAISPGELGLLDAVAENGDMLMDSDPVPTFSPISPLTAPSLASHSLLGRTEEIATLRQYLQKSGRIALTGLPGVGKTTLAAFIAHLPDIATCYPDGILWLGFGPHPPLPVLLGQLALRLGLPASELPQLASLPALAQRVQALADNRHLLVILDDLWQIEDVACFVLTGDHLSLLLTTRFPAVAHAFALERTVALAEFDDQQSLQLLAQIAPQVVEQYPEPMQDLATAVGGLPLALTLMGWYLQTHHLSGQVRRVQTAISYLRQPDARLHLAEPLPVMDQHRWPTATALRSLHAVIALSVDHLHPEEQALLQALAFFPPKPNTFSEDAGYAVSGMDPQDYLTTLDGLVDAGLVESHLMGRYSIHQTIVEYIGHPTVSFTTLQLVANYYVTLTEEKKDDYISFDSEVGNVFTILYTANHLSRFDGLLRLTQHVALFLFQRGREEEAEEYLKRCRISIHSDNITVEEIAIVLLLGKAALNLSRLEEALALVVEGGMMAKQVASVEMEAAALQLQGEIQRRIGHPQVAAEAFQSGWHLIQGHTLQHPMNYRLVSSFLMGLGNITMMNGDLQQAEIWYRQGLTNARDNGSTRNECAFLLCLGTITSERGDPETGYQLFHEAYMITQHVQLQDLALLALINLALSAADLGRLEIAQQWGEEAVAFARKIRNDQRLCYALNNLSGVMIELGNYETAERYLHEGLELAERTKGKFLHAALLVTWGGLLHKQQKTEAESVLKQARQLAEEAQYSAIIVDSDLELGEYYYRCREWESALASFTEARQLAERAEFHVRHGNALFGMARTAWAMGDREAASQLAEQSMGILQQAHSRYALEVQQWQVAHPTAGNVSTNSLALAEDLE